MASNSVVPAAAASLTAPLHLLFVEDEQIDVELTVLTLEQSDIQFTYDTVDTLAACRQFLQERTYTAVLSDYRLPGFTAYQTLEQLRQSGQDIPLILVTGTLGEEAAVECIKAGMTDYVLKDRLFRLPMVLARSLEELALRRQKAAAMARLEQQTKQEQLLNQIGRSINSSLDPETILEKIVQLTGEWFQVDRVVIYAQNSEYLEILKEWRLQESIDSLLGVKLQLAEMPELQDPNSEAWSHRVFHAPHCSQHACCQEVVRQHPQVPARSMLRVPIFIRDRLFGGLVLHTITSERIFSQDEIHILERIADQSALALYNAQSYERLEQLVKQRTQELEAEKQLSDAANRAKSEFLAHMSHELRTPLTGILGFSSLLTKQIFGELNSKQQQYVAGITSCGQHLLELINDLLDLSKIEAGKEELFLEPVHIPELCHDCLNMLRELAHRRSLSLSLSIDPNLSLCLADHRRLKQILFNLLSNAVKFTESGSITLQVQQRETTLQFAVTDTGIGISAADQSKLFQAFQQIDGGLSRKYEGTGLGLALARKLARLHGGDITVESELGQGSCFTLHLPLKLPAQTDIPDIDTVLSQTHSEPT